MTDQIDALRTQLSAVEHQLLELYRQAKGPRRKQLEDALVKANIAKVSLNGMR